MKTAFSVRPGACPLALAAAFPLLLSLPSWAQPVPTPQLKETVVTATRSAQPIGDVVADVTVIASEAIARAGPVGVADLLARTPGVEITRNGGVGNQTSVFLRGGEGRHTAVLIDGVRIDSQTTSGGANWSAIPLSQIDRIEVVRGPTSAVYGSDAVAGVVQIFTKRGEGPFAPSVTLGYGSYRTHRADVSASGSVDAFDYSFGVSEGESEGFNIRPVAGQNPDKDGYRNTSANARLGYQLNPDHRLEATLLHSRSDAQYDSGLTRDYRRINTLETVGLQWLAKWSDAYSTKLAYSHGMDRGEEAIGGATDQTRIDNLLLLNEYRIGAHLFTATLEQRRDAFELSSAPRIDRSKSQSGAGLGYGWREGRQTVQLNLRRDHDSEFGGKGTGSAAYAFALTPQWKASASVGTSFRTPTLYQRFSQYGVANLRPESGRNTELGLKYAQGGSDYGIAVYRNKLTDLLTFLSGAGAAGCPVPANGCYSNTARAQYEGVTFSASEQLGLFRLYGSLDLQNPKDLTTHRQLARRARRHGTVGVDTVVGGWTLGADALLSGRRFDTAANTTVLPGYGVLNLSASTPLARDWTLLARIDNVNDKLYQTAIGYAQARRTAYLALTWAPQ